MISQQLGKLAEDQALHYLQQQKLTLLERNFRCRVGEIDLIMREQAMIVFVEVRYRTSSTYGTAAETILYHKQQKIIKTALLYLQWRRLNENTACRFDVVALTANQPIQWIKDAFQISY